jgi:hypothetical protein
VLRAAVVAGRRVRLVHLDADPELAADALGLADILRGT